jgi:hypothetical protein
MSRTGAWSMVVGMRSQHSATDLDDADPWVLDLRDRLIEDGYELARVLEVLTNTLGRFRHAPIRDYVPLLVERSVERALREG